jgi:D-mannonate dehydratase
MFRKILAVILATLTVACATQEQTASLECGAAGLGIAFLACKLAGGNDAACAAIGGAAGLGIGAVCYNLSATLDKQRQELAGHENDLDARLRYIKSVNTAIASYNERMKTDLVTITQHTNSVVLQIQQKSIDQQSLEKERTYLDTQLKKANESLASQRQSVDLMRKLQAEHNFQDPQLTQELQRQQTLLAQTEQQTAALASQRQRI